MLEQIIIAIACLVFLIIIYLIMQDRQAHKLIMQLYNEDYEKMAKSRKGLQKREVKVQQTKKQKVEVQEKQFGQPHGRIVILYRDSVPLKICMDCGRYDKYLGEVCFPKSNDFYWRAHDHGWREK